VTRPARLTRDAQCAWLAGLYEGEGTLYRQTDARNGSVSYHLRLPMTDEDTVRRAHEIAGVGYVYALPRRQVGWKPQWVWVVRRRDDIAHVIRDLLPWLGNRRATDARRFLDWYDSL